MDFLAWVVIGLIAGGIARMLLRDERSGCVYTMVVGVLGAVIGGALMKAIDERGVNEFSFRSIVVSVLGACLLLLVLQALGARSSRHRR